MTSPEPLHPIDALLEEISLQRQRALRGTPIDIADELAFRLYPLLSQIVETLADCIDAAIEEAAESDGTAPLSQSLAGRIVVVLASLLKEVLRCVDEHAPRPTSQTADALAAEAKEIVAELIALFSGERPTVDIASNNAVATEAATPPAMEEAKPADPTNADAPNGIFGQESDDV